MSQRWVLTHPKLIVNDRIMEYVDAFDSQKALIDFCKIFFITDKEFVDDMDKDVLVQHVKKHGYILLLDGTKL